MKGMGLESLGIKFNVPKISAAQTADSDSALDVSQYTYYSETADQSALQDGEAEGESKGANNDPTAMNIGAEIEAAEKEEAKKESTPNNHRDRSNEDRHSSSTIELVDKDFQNFSKTPRDIPSTNIAVN